MVGRQGEGLGEVAAQQDVFFLQDSFKDTFSKCLDKKVIFFHDTAHLNNLTTTLCLQCFDAVGWAAGRTSGL